MFSGAGQNVNVFACACTRAAVLVMLVMLATLRTGGTATASMGTAGLLPHVFALGPGSTGSHTIRTVLSDTFNYTVCHFECAAAGKRDSFPWSDRSLPFFDTHRQLNSPSSPSSHGTAPLATAWARYPWPAPATLQGMQARTAHDPMWARFNAFADMGHLADFEWLERTFPHARFLYNGRGMAAHIASTARHFVITGRIPHQTCTKIQNPHSQGAWQCAESQARAAAPPAL